MIEKPVRTETNQSNKVEILPMVYGVEYFVLMSSVGYVIRGSPPPAHYQEDGTPGFIALYDMTGTAFKF